MRRNTDACDDVKAAMTTCRGFDALVFSQLSVCSWQVFAVGCRLPAKLQNLNPRPLPAVRWRRNDPALRYRRALVFFFRAGVFAGSRSPRSP